MLNTSLRSRVLVAWFSLLTLSLTLMIAVGASLTTIAVLFILGITPPAIMVLIVGGPSSPTVAEILHTDSKDGGR
jgi:hypothetical protein